MSMIEEQIKELGEIHDELLENVELDCDINDFKEDWAKKINGAMRTIKELSAKLHAAQMERSSQYYNNGWTPLDDYDPPAKNGIYEVTAYWHETWQTLQAEYIDGHWFVITRMGVLKDIPVEAWRYVVKPYQPKESEE